MFKANTIISSKQELLSCCFCYHVSPNINKLWLLLCYLRVRFQLVSPPGFHFNTHTEGEPCIHKKYISVFFSPIDILSPPAAGLSSCSRLRGTQGAGLDPIRKFGPRPRSVARAVGLEVARPLGEAFRARRAIQAHANPHVHNTLLTG